MTEPDRRESVRIVDLDMPFKSMIRFMVKWAIASIPALLILLVIGAIVGGLLTGFTAALVSRLTSSADDTPAIGAFDPDSLVSASGRAAPQWVLSQSTNPIDDSPTVVLSLRASGPEETMLRRAPSLILRCSRKKTEVYINWNQYLGLDEIRVTTRVGRAQASSRMWGLSTDNEATFFPGNAGSFVSQLMAADTLIAMTTPYCESPVTAIFVTTGLTANIGPLRTACDW